MSDTVTASGLIVSVPVAEEEPYVPVTVAITCDATVDVGTVTVTDVEVAGTSTLAGICAEVAAVFIVTDRPPVGAGLLIVTVICDELPPITEAGRNDTPVTVGAVTVSVSDALELLVDAVMFAVVFVATGMVVMVNVCEVAPAGTVTVPGTPATALTRPPRNEPISRHCSECKTCVSTS